MSGMKETLTIEISRLGPNNWRFKIDSSLQTTSGAGHFSAQEAAARAVRLAGDWLHIEAVRLDREDADS